MKTGDRSPASTSRVFSRKLCHAVHSPEEILANCNLSTARKGRTMTDFMRDELGAPKVVDRSIFHAELDALRVREKAHTKEGDAIAAAR